MATSIRKAFLLASILAIATSCGRLHGASGPASSTAQPDEQVQPLPSDAVNDPLAGTNWDNPIAGTTVGSVAEAQASMPFQVFGENVLGSPIHITIVPEAEVALAYDTDQYGRVDLSEGSTQQSDTDWAKAAQQLVSDTGKPGYYGAAETLDFPNGVVALITTSVDGTHSSAEWVYGGISVAIFGPSLDKQAVEIIAPEIAAAFAASPSPAATPS